LSTSNLNKTKLAVSNILVEIDPSSGFCFGVKNAVNKALDELNQYDELYSLGQIVHNPVEVKRLEDKGLKVIDHEKLKNLKNAHVLFRAHGEPPESYDKLKEQNITLIDATCPVVIKLQQRVKKAYLKTLENNGQVVIYGKRGHAEVIGLIGQTDGKAILVESTDDLVKIDFSRPIELFSQTTKDVAKFRELADIVQQKAMSGVEYHDTICRQVSNRGPLLKEFATRQQVMIFVGGLESSNAKVLYNLCKQVNPNSYFVEKADEIQSEWFKGAESIGISGATSTPAWLISEVKDFIINLLGGNN
jgi:4-hydroxy-3-methylbut-2-en-1-yl diphosphate reductase